MKPRMDPTDREKQIAVLQKLMERYPFTGFERRRVWMVYDGGWVLGESRFLAAVRLVFEIASEHGGSRAKAVRNR